MMSEELHAEARRELERSSSMPRGLLGGGNIILAYVRGNAQRPHAWIIDCRANLVGFLVRDASSDVRPMAGVWFLFAREAVDYARIAFAFWKDGEFVYELMYAQVFGGVRPARKNDNLSNLDGQDAR